MNVYEGSRGEDGVIVTVNGKPLPLRLDIVNHSPTGFEWGYGGSGPAQLAIAILAYELGEKQARKLYQDFKWDMIAPLPQDSWKITSTDIQEWLEKRQLNNTNKSSTIYISRYVPRT